MKLGAFSVSLAVKDINKSKEFYANLGFVEVGGDINQGWLILRNDEHTIGLFQGMFDCNIMTFNPGWNQNCETLDEFDTVRDIHASLKDQGIETEQENLNESGPGSFVTKDPDGNVILFDQHV